jgi:hypothetical protein
VLIVTHAANMRLKIVMRFENVTFPSEKRKDEERKQHNNDPYLLGSGNF